MRRFILVVVCLILIAYPVRAGAREVTDHAGRTVVLPEHVESVYATSLSGSIFLYTLAPDRLAGWNIPLDGKAAEFIAPSYRDLPTLGTWRSADSTGNVEEILRVNPCLIINMGDINDGFIRMSDRMQTRLGIPVLMVDGSLAESERAYHLLGQVLDQVGRASELAEYARATLANLAESREQLEERVSVFYAAGPRGLETAGRYSMNAEVIEYAGGQNVVSTPAGQVLGRVEVSFEQLLLWDPDVVVVSDSQGSPLLERILSERAWQGFSAVASGRVYRIPAAPFNWFNRPPSIMRLLGAKWLLDRLYPDHQSFCMEAETRQFFRLFFAYEVSEQDAFILRTGGAGQ